MNVTMQQNNPMQLLQPRSGRRRTHRQSDRQRNLEEQRLQRQAREMQMREQENERLAGLHEGIQRTEDMAREGHITHLQKREITAKLTQQIERIHASRAARARINEEMDTKMQQMQLEMVAHEMTEIRPQESRREEEDEDDEDAIQRENIRGLTRLAVASDNIQTLRHTRARMGVEAALLNDAIAFDTTPVVQTLPNGDMETIQVASGHSNPNDYWNRQLSRLTEGMARIDVAIQTAISRLYRETQAWKDNMQDLSHAKDVEEIQEGKEEEQMDVTL
jgi:hypothetical protein